MRLIGKDIAVFKVDSAGPTKSYLTTLKSLSIRVTKETQENGAIKDLFHYMQVVRENWTATFKLQLTDAEFPPILSLAQAGTSVLLSGKLSATGTGTNVNFAATGVITEYGPTVERGAQEMDFTISPQSLMTFSAV